LIFYFLDDEFLAGILHKLHVCSPSLLEAEIDDSFLAKFKKVFKSSEK